MNSTRISIGMLSIILLTSASVFALDHSYGNWDQFLNRHVKDGLVNYSVIKKSPAEFGKIVRELEGVTLKEYESWSNPEKMAFWINAYNVGAIKHILDNYPIRKSFGLSALRYPANSIQQIPGVWDNPILNLLGKKVSLNEIENERLRKEFDDPRIHFAIVCASIGCPVLRDEPYISHQLDSQLDDAVVEFLQDTKKFKYDGRSNTYYLSPIFKWFKDDFEKTGGSTVFIEKYIPQNKNLPDNGQIQWQDYDWSLNEQK